MYSQFVHYGNLTDLRSKYISRKTIKDTITNRWEGREVKMSKYELDVRSMDIQHYCPAYIFHFQ